MMSNFAPRHDTDPNAERVTFADYPRVEMLLYDKDSIIDQITKGSGEVKFGETVSHPPIINGGELITTDLEGDAIAIKGYIDIDFSQFDVIEDNPWEDTLLNAVANDLVPSDGRSFSPPHDWAVYIPVEDCAHYLRISVQSNMDAGTISLETVPYYRAHQIVETDNEPYWDGLTDDDTKATLFVKAAAIWAQLHGIIIEELSENKTAVTVSLSPAASIAEESRVGTEKYLEPAHNLMERRDFSEIGGNFVVKERLGLLIDVFKNSELAKQYSVTVPPILLYGPPGTGKDTLMEIFASQVGGDLRTVSSSEVVEKWVGNSARNLEKIFDDAIEGATENTPIILFFNEFEALGTKSENLSTSERIDLLNIFSQRIDKLARNPAPIILAAATNADIQDLEPKLTRPGRFEPIQVGLPSNSSELADIWAAILTREGAYHVESFEGFSTGEQSTSIFSQELDIPSLAGQSEGMSGATIVEALRLAKQFSFRQALAGKEVVPITTEVIAQALREIRMR